MWVDLFLMISKMAKQTAVSVKEARLIDQWLHTTIASVTFGDIINFFSNDLKKIDKIVSALDGSEVYKIVGWEIEAKAHELVDTKCRPERDKISEEMRPLWELRNKLAEKKAKGEGWTDEDEAQLNWLDKEMSDLSNEYQKVTDEANAELNEFKEKRINEEKEPAFFLSEEDYKLIGGYCGF